MTTLASRIERASGRGAVTFVSGTSHERVPWARLHDEARAMAAGLQVLGVGPGAHVGILGATTRPLVTAIQATWLCGATTIVLPLPMRLGSIEEFVRQTRVRVLDADASVVLVDPDFAPFLEPVPGDPPMVLFDEIPSAKGERYERPADDPEELAILQFTSGSTSDPKGVMIPHRTVLANVDAIAEAAHLDVEDDVLVSWLPLYHDMGLIGLLTMPMATGADLVLAAPQDFLAAPARWMEWLAHFGGTATAGPNFSYALAARALRRSAPLDLSRWRLGLNGAEPVDPDAVEAFVAAGAPHALDAGSVFPAFGMAEATLAVTFPEPGSGLRTDAVDRRVLEVERYAAPSGAGDARRLALLGRPVPGLEIRVVDAAGNPLGDREAGELQVRGTSVTPGYYKRPDVTSASFDGDWLRTGDLAYLLEGELVVCGRIKDVIIVGGRNVFPEDVERAVAGVEGVRPGNVIAFGVDGRKGREALVVVAETKSEDIDLTRRLVGERVVDAVGIPGEVVLVQPGSLPKTSSGKLQRSLCRDRYLGTDLAEV
jgi:fatty-acyl-CoA synthase